MPIADIPWAGPCDKHYSTSVSLSSRKVKDLEGVPRCLPNPSETSYQLLLHKPSQAKKCLCHKLIMTASLQALSDMVKFILSRGLTNPIRAPLSDCMDTIIPLALNNREMFVFN